MDKEKAKEFIFLESDESKIYISKNVYDLIKLNDNSPIGVYAVVDTENGEKMFNMDFDHSGEPIITRVFLHKEYFLKYHRRCKKNEL